MEYQVKFYRERDIFPGWHYKVWIDGHYPYMFTSGPYRTIIGAWLDYRRYVRNGRNRYEGR